jgi:hypothetical protein
MNAKSSVGENITIDAKHNEMLKYFKDLQKSLPALKNELKESIQKYKSIDLSKNNDFELIMEKDRLRDSIVELKERINKISSKEEENNYFLEVGLLLHNYYENVETAKNVESDSKNFEKNLLYTSDNENDNIIQDEEEDELEDGDDEIESVPEKVSYKSVINFFNDRESKGDEKEKEKDNGYTSMKISDFVKEEAVFKKKNILDDYLKKIDNNYVSKIKVDMNICKCPNCNEEMILYPSDGIQICDKCGLQENILIESDKPSFKDPPMEVSYFSYKRINHYNEFGTSDKKTINEYLTILLKEIKKLIIYFL